MRPLLLTLLAFPVLAAPLVAQQTPDPAAQAPGWVDSTDWNAITTSYLLSPDGQEGTILNKPFTAVEERHSEKIHPDHTFQDHLDTNQVHRDAQGRMRVQGSRIILIFDPVSNRTYVLHRAQKDYKESQAVYASRERSFPTALAVYGENGYTGTTDNYPGPVRQVVLHEVWGAYPANFTPTNHVEAVDLGTQTINGQLCRGTRVTLTIPAHAKGGGLHVIHERWYSDDLQALIRSSIDDPRFGVSTYELKDIRRGDPDPTLFKLPEGYTPTTHPDWIIRR